MNLDSPRESGSMSMDIDDDAVPCCHPDSSCGRTGFDFHHQNHQLAESSLTSIHSLSSHPPPDCERLPGSDDSMVLAPSSSPVNHPVETGNMYQHQGLAGQHGVILPGQEVTTRKRKHSYDLPHTHVTGHDRISHDADGAHSQSRRRVRPRQRTQQDREFTPLLTMSPGRERESLVEETISAFDYPPAVDVTGSFHSIRRHFCPRNLSEDGPRILQSSSSPKVDDLEDQERGRSNTVNSFAEVALASTATRKHGRLSTLQDFWLPRPFEESGPSMGSLKVHERGLEVPPSFLSTSGGRMDGPRSSREDSTRAVSPQPALHPLELSMGKFFNKPMCDSPESISPDEGGLAHLERPTTQVIHSAHYDSPPHPVRTTDNNDG
ncbi:hypothetical protein L210DRAFT_928706 [Boletus edulis BED1]|uniref:Uncharacterized protein n=1 Tax=Boletus edulis BED1 TaxID=1328754 RepID=A0AAD4GI70_BOLED|nr:hypothetical protein L210DRAFT_928706 [Boletus edulis BED1]